MPLPESSALSRIGWPGSALRARLGGQRPPYLLAVIALLVLAVTNAILQPTFLQFGVITSNVAAFLPLALVAVGQTYVVLASDIDLSAGAIVSMVNVTVVTIIETMGGTGGSIALGLAVGVIVGIAGGALNGFCVAVLRFQPIVTTFATSIVFSGIALWVLPEAGRQVPPEFYTAYAGWVLGIPTVVWILGGAVLFAAIVARSRYYQALRATGGSIQAAYQTGLPVARVRFTAYAISGLFSAAAGLALVGETASGDPLIGQALTLSSVTAVVLGGTALSGCVGGVAGSILGAFILGLISNVIFFAQLPFEWQGLVQGAIILAALAGGVVMARGKGG
jgi:ribose transport system permease protein